MKVILYPNIDNSLSVVSPNADLPIERVIELSVPKNTPYKVVENLNIDDSFFDAYEYDNSLGAKLNLSEAKQVHLNRFRRARVSILASLDIEFMRAVESGNTTLQNEIANKKQTLRDITSINLPDTLEGIKATWPAILGPSPYITNN